MNLVKVPEEKKDLLSWIDDDGNLVQFDLPETEISIKIYSNASIQCINKLQQVLIDLCTSVIIPETRLTSTSAKTFLNGSSIRTESIRIISSMNKHFYTKDIKQRRP